MSSWPPLTGVSDVISSTASIYLFRFDPQLTTEFVQHSFTALARRAADAVGWSVEESRRVVLRSFHDSSKLYFSCHWDTPEIFVRANSAALAQIRRRHARRLDIVLNGLGPNENAVRQVDSVSIDKLISTSTAEKPLLVKVYADYCSTCGAMAPRFEDAARTLYGQGVNFAALDGPRNISTTEALRVTLYPSVLRFKGPGLRPEFLSRPHTRSTNEFVAFALSSLEDSLDEGGVDGNSSGDSVSTLVPATSGARSSAADAASISAEHDMDPMGQVLSQWVGMLRRQGIDELENLVRDRDIFLHRQIDDALGSCSETSCLPPQVSDADGSRPVDYTPVVILLGGGMGSGKSGSITQLSRTAFWRERGSNVVVVEADAFKARDPVFTALNAIGVYNSSRVVHAKSLEGAEELFLQATQVRFKSPSFEV
jgi:thiol-disulfide isomerase/thioredoxin